MKKKSLILAGVFLCLTFSACAGIADSSVENTDVTAEKQADSTEAESEEISTEKEETEESETAAEENTVIYNMGDTVSFKDWEITITDVQMIDSVTEGYMVYEPNEEGSKFAQVFITVTNVGEQTDTFMPSYVYGEDIYTQLLYGDGSEYMATNLLGYDAGMFSSSIEPAAQKSGEIVFEIPESVASAADELLIKFNSGNDGISFKLR